MLWKSLFLISNNDKWEARSVWNKFKEIIEMNRNIICQSGHRGLPMSLRLFLFLTLFLSSILLGVLLILFIAGMFRTGQLVHKPILEGELNHITDAVSKSFGRLSAQAVELSKELSISMEQNIKERGGSLSNLQEYPELLENLLDEELDRLVGALEKSRASGVFILLDATVNPYLPGSENSRSCIYLKNMEPNIVNEMSANMRYYTGPMTIARKNGIHILPQWQMEMDIKRMPYFEKVITTAREQKLPLSRLYKWSRGIVLPGYSERAMLCMVPLLTSDGTVFGICGFDVSEMLFKLSYTPKSKDYNHLICMLSPVYQDKLHLYGALFAGNFSEKPDASTYMTFDNFSLSNGFYKYTQPEKVEYAGLHQIISLYPNDSAFANEHWVVVLMMPRHEFNNLISAKNRLLAIGLLLLLFFNIGLAFIISHTYVRPVTDALEYLKQPTQAIKTKIPEIDDLIEFLAAQDKFSKSSLEKKELPDQKYYLCREFIKNVQTLSPAEKAVFDLYVQGYRAKEIAEILCLSINTIKTHNRRIYMKLNVTSRKELMLYIQMIKEANLPII